MYKRYENEQIDLNQRGGETLIKRNVLEVVEG